MRLSFLRPLAIAAAAMVVPGAARADYLTGFSGNSVVSAPNATADGVINFAVFENTGGGSFLGNLGATAAAVQITGSNPANFSTVDTTARYVYMFQVVNTAETGGSSANVIRLNVQVEPGHITGFGVLRNQIFTEDTGGSAGPDATVGPAGNTRLDGLAADPAGGVNTTTTLTAMGGPGTSATAVGLATDNTAILNGITGQITPAGDPFNQPASPNMEFSMTLAGGQYSSILFFTSNVAPVFRLGATSAIAGATTVFSVGQVPSPNPTPEPGTMALLGLGLAGVGARQLRRRMKGAAESATAV